MPLHLFCPSTAYRGSITRWAWRSLGAVSIGIEAPAVGLAYPRRPSMIGPVEIDEGASDGAAARIMDGGDGQLRPAFGCLLKPRGVGCAHGHASRVPCQERNLHCR